MAPPRVQCRVKWEMMETFNQEKKKGMRDSTMNFNSELFKRQHTHKKEDLPREPCCGDGVWGKEKRD